MHRSVKKKLLVIDDDPFTLTILKTNLENFGYETILAESWSRAEEALASGFPGLMILDVMLPDGNGIDICRKVKSRYPNIPVILLTGRNHVSDKVMGLESGAEDYIVKPFEVPELIARVEACLRRSTPQEEREAVGDLVVDLKARTVHVRGREVDLTPKEYDLLCLFLSKHGEVITREFIRKSLWPSSHLYSDSRVIDVHVLHLRQKIEQNPSEPEYIVTVPGAGYKFAR